MIYFAGPDYPHMVKIGYTQFLAGRLEDIQMYCPLPIFGRAFCEGDVHREHELHVQFRDHNVRGEWFTFDAPIQDFIRDHCEPWSKMVPIVRERKHPPHKGSNILIGGDAEFKAEWMNLALDMNISCAKVLDLAMASYAMDRGFRPPPPFPEADKPLVMRGSGTTGYGVLIKANKEWVEWIAEFAWWDDRHFVSPMARQAIKQLKENSPVVC